MTKSRTAAQRSYGEIVTALGEDQKVSPAEAEQAMQAAGVSAEQLEADIATYQDRKQKLETLAECRKAHAECNQLEAQMKALQEEADEVTRKLNEKHNTLRIKLSATVSQINREQWIEQRLMDSAPAWTSEKLAEIQEQRMTLGNQLRTLQQDRATANSSKARELRAELASLDAESEKLRARQLECWPIEA
ncbi:hypothetical protein [Bythopirellula polymerisocia]|uniref:hypothetical protein n=1 Tax=Bythopirellula polymerisocia TaxID=2528003 RepID=UPI0011B4158E|nr:hypothetical protein [Bythopirellula polymerisocia]